MSGCINLSDISFPNNLISIESDAFRDCSSLTNVIIPETIGSFGPRGVFCGCSIVDLKILANISASNLHGSTDTMSSLKNIEFGSKNKSKGLTDVPPGFCGKFYNLESAIIHESVVTIGAGAFAGCPNLKHIDLAEGVININEGAFNSTSPGLEKITLPSTVINIDEKAFANNLKTITLKKGSEPLNIKKSAFAFATGLTDIYYTGSEEDWNTLVNIDNTDDGNANFNNATKHFEQEAP